jgi:transglutaminase-like putative cysteine protease
MNKILVTDYVGDVRNDGVMRSLMAFVQPDDSIVRIIAGELREPPDFVLACRYYVNKHIRYYKEANDLWRTPREVLDLGYGDCEKSSVLLASLLRYSYSGDEVFVVIGQIRDQKREYGHAWVQLKETILESTKDVNYRANPANYFPELMFSDQRAYKITDNDFGYIPVMLDE